MLLSLYLLLSFVITPSLHLSIVPILRIAPTSPDQSIALIALAAALRRACVDNLLEGMGAENALQLAQCLVRCMEQRILVDDGSMHRTLQRVMHTLLPDPTDTVLRYLDMLVVKRPETVPASALMKDLNLATRAEQNTRVTLESYTNVMTPLTQPMVIPVQGKTPSDRDHRVGIEIPLHRRLWLALKLIAPIMAYDPQRGETRLRRALCSKSRALRIIFDPMEFRRLLASGEGDVDVAVTVR